jgi:septum site-determining protein MinC
VNQANPAKQRFIRFRARSLVAFVLSPEAPFSAWLQGLDAWTANSPGFFVGRPVVLDLALLKTDAAEVRDLVAELARRDIRVFAMETAQDIEAPDLPPILRGGRPSTMEDLQSDPVASTQSGAQSAPPNPPALPSLLIETPVRSGQSIIHPQGDVIVLGSTGSGSEIVAGGSIHVYGTLRGRALAGAMGNGKARIFCRKNEAELLAVDGCYQTAEDMDAATRGRPAQCYLDNDVLWIVPLD